MGDRAALYLRSSKDRKDVSTQDQRRELTELARARSWPVAGEFVDVVESGKDEDRPGFQALLRAIRDPRRGWNKLLIKDTSRLARRRALAVIFEESECRRHGVDVVFANIPDGDQISSMLLKSIMQAMDEWHSLTSREKGLAGMMENVRRGYRGAGIAPHGYRLKRVQLGMVREGAPVTKAVLEPTEDLPAVGKYLSLRALGIPRPQAIEQSGIRMRSPSSLISTEWNALTYAGCTTFGVFNERASSGAGYKTGRKRQPRAKWLVTPDTHPAAITTEQAERILRQLETSDHGAAVSAAKSGNSRYLLAGLLQTPAGQPWSGNEGKYYRAPIPGRRGRYVPSGAVEEAVLGQILGSLRSDAFAEAVAAQARASAPALRAPVQDLEREIARVASQIDKAQVFMLEAQEPAAWGRKIDELERRRARLLEELQGLQDEAELAEGMGQVTAAAVKELLADQAERLADASTEDVKVLLRGLVDRIELDPVDLTCRVHYRIASENRVSMALLRKRQACAVLITPGESVKINYIDGRSLRWKRADGSKR